MGPEPGPFPEPGPGPLLLFCVASPIVKTRRLTRAGRFSARTRANPMAAHGGLLGTPAGL